jgi:N-acetylglucosamine-6-sulfatase
VVVIMVDDLAEMDLRLWDRLPAIRSQFIDHGLRFTDYYGNDPLCCPGRANFMTGLYTDHHGVWKNDARLLDPSVTLATRLHGVGYHTFISGKYLNLTQLLKDKTPPGWDETAIYSGGYYRYPAWINGVQRNYGSAPADYSVDVFADAAVRFIHDAPANKPIFAFLTPYATHDGPEANGSKDPYQPAVAPRYRDDPRCAGIKPWRPANYNEANVSDKPAYIRSTKPLHMRYGLSYSQGWPLKLDCEALLSVNDEFVRVRDALTSEGRLANTLFLLTGDNGMGFGAHRWPKKDVPYAAQLPMFASWSAGSSWALSGSTNAAVENVDWAPTICELAGCSMGPYPNGQPDPDGRSILGLIAPSLSASLPARQGVYLEHRQALGIRPVWRGLVTTAANPLGRWMYVLYGDGEEELYKLGAGSCATWSRGDPGDPCLLHNLAGQPVVRRIQLELHHELARMVVNPLPRVP